MKPVADVLAEGEKVGKCRQKGRRQEGSGEGSAEKKKYKQRGVRTHLVEKADEIKKKRGVSKGSEDRAVPQPMAGHPRL